MYMGNPTAYMSRTAECDQVSAFALTISDGSVQTCSMDKEANNENTNNVLGNCPICWICLRATKTGN